MRITQTNHYVNYKNYETTQSQELKQHSNKVANRLLFASFIGVSGLAIGAQCYGRKTTPIKLLKEWSETLINHLKNK